MPAITRSRQSTRCFGGVASAGQVFTLELLGAQIEAQELVSHGQSRGEVCGESNQTGGGMCKS
jgi:hypothetical protein